MYFLKCQANPFKLQTNYHIHLLFQRDSNNNTAQTKHLHVFKHVSGRLKNTWRDLSSVADFTGSLVAMWWRGICSFVLKVINAHQGNLRGGSHIWSQRCKHWGGDRWRRRKDKQVLKYLGQSNRGLVWGGRCGSRPGPGLREGHVKVECGWAGYWPEAPTVKKDYFFP